MDETHLEALELGYYEVKFAFEGLADDNVWRRPSPGILSVGELAGHIAYWEAVRLAGKGGAIMGDGGEEAGPDPAECWVNSLLVDRQFGYYPNIVAAAPSERHLAMTAGHVCKELLRVHKQATAYFKVLNPSLESSGPEWPPFWTYAQTLKYLAFHVSYHTGQMFSARHLLGDKTPDN